MNNISMLQQHKLAKILAAYPIGFRRNMAMSISIFNFNESTVIIKSFSDSYVSALYRGRKFNFNYIIIEEKVIYAIEYHTGLFHNFGKGIDTKAKLCD